MTPNDSRKSESFLKATIFENLKILEIVVSANLLGGGATNPEHPSVFVDLEYGIKFFPNTCNGNLVIWDQHLSNSMK